MGKFLNTEKITQAQFKQTALYFPEAARADGEYKHHNYPYCLPRNLSEQNLVPGIRTRVQEYFERHEIKWHDAIDHCPSNHMCDSQVCGVNFLFAFADKPNALAELLRPVYPNLQTMLPMEDDLYVACEWIGLDAYLGEIKRGNQKRTRGANFTSADMAVSFERTDGRKQIVLIEWKYTESYSPSPLHKAKSGRDRTLIYEHLYKMPDCPLDHAVVGEIGNLFYEPFYQLMRQQFLAREMERAHELDADVVSVLHIAPCHNLDFRRVTSPALYKPDLSVIDVWKKIVRDADCFASVYTEDLFGRFHTAVYPELEEWWKYIETRYRWISEEMEGN